jgi:uncharacterized protein
MSVFRIRLSDLRPGSNRIRLQAPAAAAGLDPEAWSSPLDLDLGVDRLGDQLTLRGTASTRIEEECARCLRRFESAMVFEFSAFADRSASLRGADAEALGEYLLQHDGRSLDLADEVREQAILARPMLSLCRPNCAGLCPRCGADLNLGPCGCTGAGASGASPGGPST